MTREQIKEAREKVLAFVLLQQLAACGDEVALLELRELFEMESLPVAAKFFSYSGFGHWVRKHPELNVAKRGSRVVLLLDESAEAFAKQRVETGVDIEVTPMTFRCMPIGDFSTCQDQEVAP